jgi:hypothetical protein
VTDSLIGQIGRLAISRRAFLASGPCAAALAALEAGPPLAGPCRGSHQALAVDYADVAAASG